MQEEDEGVRVKNTERDHKGNAQVSQRLGVIHSHRVDVAACEKKKEVVHEN